MLATPEAAENVCVLVWRFVLVYVWCITGSVYNDFVFHVYPEAGPANEGVLANFFNSLLSKKTGAPGSPGSGAVGAGVQGSAKKTGTISLSFALTGMLSFCFNSLFLTDLQSSFI